MASLVGGSSLTFALVKIGFTAAGVVLLAHLARIRAFGRIPVGRVPVLRAGALRRTYYLRAQAAGRGVGGPGAPCDGAAGFCVKLSVRRFSFPMLEPTPLYGGNADFLDALYEQYLRDPASVGAE